MKLFQIESDVESESIFDSTTPKRENGRRSSTAATTTTTNNNTEIHDTVPTNKPGTPNKTVRSNSETTEGCEKTCLTTMSGSSIA